MIVSFIATDAVTRTVGDGPTESTLKNSIKNASQRKIPVPIQSATQRGSQAQND